MAIVTVLAMQTVIAIVTVLAIKTDIHGYRDCIILETDIHFSEIEPDIKCKELVLEEIFEPQSPKRRLSRLSLVFYVVVFPWLETFYCVVTFLIAVKISEMTQVLVSRTDYVGSLVCLCFKQYCFAKSLFWRSRHSRTARSIDASIVGACLKDPELAPGIWPRYERDD